MKIAIIALSIVLCSCATVDYRSEINPDFVFADGSGERICRGGMSVMCEYQNLILSKRGWELYDFNCYVTDTDRKGVAEMKYNKRMIMIPIGGEAFLGGLQSSRGSDYMDFVKVDSDGRLRFIRKKS